LPISWRTTFQFIDQNHGWLTISSNGSPIYYSTDDGGLSWELHTYGPWWRIHTLFFADTLNGWLTANNGFWHTTDGGDTWFEIDAPKWGKFQFIDSLRGWAYDGNILTTGTLHKTLDGGYSWTQISAETSVLFQYVDSTHGWSLCPENYLWKTTENGNVWTQQLSYSNPIGGFTQVKFCDTNNGIVLSEGIIWKTVNGGNNWNPVVYNLPIDINQIFFIDYNIILLTSGDRIMKSVDGGASWELIYGAEDFYLLNVSVLDSMIFFLGDYIDGKRAMRSLDLGDNWQNMNLDTSITYGLHSDEFIQFLDNNMGFISGIEYQGRDHWYNNWVTRDGGINWTSISLPAMNYFYFTDSVNGYATGTTYSDEWDVTSHFFKTIDNGQTWIEIEGIPIWTGISFTDKDNGWLINNWEIHYSHDGGYNWSLYEIAPCNVSYNSIIFADHGKGWITSNCGILHTGNAGGFLSVEESSVVGRQSSVHVYPNPTNGVLSFRFQVSSSQHITLKIYDLHGREAAMVVDEWMPVGEHFVSFDARSLPPGIYIYRISNIEFRVLCPPTGGSSMGKLVIVR